MSNVSCIHRCTCADASGKYDVFYPVEESAPPDLPSHRRHEGEAAGHARAAREAEAEAEEDDDTSGTTLPNEVIFHVSAPLLFNQTLRLQLIPATDFLSPGFVIQRVNGSNSWLEEIADLHCFYSGYVHGEEHSVVSLAACDGMVSGNCSASPLRRLGGLEVKASASSAGDRGIAPRFPRPPRWPSG